MRLEISQVIGLIGTGLIVIGALFTVVLPQVGIPTWTGVSFFAFLFFVAGGILFWVGVLWTWVVGIARATRAWDSVPSQRIRR